MEKIWTYSVLLQLFKLLTVRYGPLETWEKRTLPGHGRDKDYHEFLSTFAKDYGAKSGGAVDLKINHVIYRDSKASPWNFHTATRYIAAAEEAGFIPPTEEAEDEKAE